jgi:hypothetical protein
MFAIVDHLKQLRHVSGPAADPVSNPVSNVQGQSGKRQSASTPAQTVGQ